MVFEVLRVLNRRNKVRKRLKEPVEGQMRKGLKVWVVNLAGV